MRCESCGTENDDNSKFCMGCGQLLAAASSTTEASTDASSTTWSAPSDSPPASSVHDPGIDSPVEGDDAAPAPTTMQVDGPPPAIAAPQPGLTGDAPPVPAPSAWGDSTPPPPAVAAPQGGLPAADATPPPAPAWGAPASIPPPPTAPPSWGQEPPPPSTPPAWGAAPATPPPPGPAAPSWGQVPPAPQGPAGQNWPQPAAQVGQGWQAPPAAAPMGPADPNGLGAAVQRSGAKAQKVSRTALAVAGALLEDGEVVEAAVAGKLEGNGAVMVLTDRALRLVDDRQWKPVTERYPIDGNLQVQGWQDERTASLTLVVAGRQLVLDQILDRPLAVEMAQRIRYRTGG